MASRRCLNALGRRFSSIFHSNSQSLKPLRFRTHFHNLDAQRFTPNINPPLLQSHYFSSQFRRPDKPKFGEDIEDEQEDEGSGETSEEDEDEDEGEMDGENEDEIGNESSSSIIKRAYSVEEKIKEAAEIGYKVIGPLQGSERVFKPYEPVFAVVQIGSHQFKVSNGDCIYTERLKFCEVNDKLILNKVLLLGSSLQTIIGRPIVPDAAVHAVVEEHALDAKVIIFKKKRRKNYRRTKGHRQELTRLRITDIQGIEKPENSSDGKTETASKKAKKVPVAA